MDSKKEARKRELEGKCRECVTEFFSINIAGRLFPYARCKRCEVGYELHELDDPRWIADYVKRDA